MDQLYLYNGEISQQVQVQYTQVKPIFFYLQNQIKMCFVILQTIRTMILKSDNKCENRFTCIQFYF